MVNFTKIFKNSINIFQLMTKKCFWDRLEDKQFTINLVGIISSIFFLVILLLVVIFSRSNLR